MGNVRNIVDAILFACGKIETEIEQGSESRNRANAMGEGLEMYVKDIFSGYEYGDRRQCHEAEFSYGGNKNNPPDIMIKNGGAAIEVKKIESFSSDIQLNSSHPKDKLYSSSTLITNACRNADGGEWAERDMIYVIGVVKGKKLYSLLMFYGEDYCANSEVYERAQRIVKDAVADISTLDVDTNTKELGRVVKVDVLNRAYMRVRGMWLMKNPFNVFLSNEEKIKAKQGDFSIIAIINERKINELGNFAELESFAENSNGKMKIDDIEIEDPNNLYGSSWTAKRITYGL